MGELISKAREVFQDFLQRLDKASRGEDRSELSDLLAVANFLNFRFRVAEAIRCGNYAELYRLWTEIIREKLTVGLLDIADIMRREGVLKNKEEYKKHQKYLEPLHDEMVRVWPPVFESLYWETNRSDSYLSSVAGAAHSAASGDKAAVDRLKALLDLVVAAHRSGDSPDEMAALEEWRGTVAKQARALAAISVCKNASLARFPDAPTDGAAQEDDGELARLLLCVFHDSATPKSIGEMDPFPLRSLATRIAKGNGCKGGANVEEVERLLNHHAFESGLARRLLEQRIGYRSWKPDFAAPRIKSLDGLELDIMMMGPKEVGKSSFLFASQKHFEEMEITRFSLESLEGNDEEIKKIEQDWKNGEVSKTGSVYMAAKVGPQKLCGFHVLDTMGEFVTQGEEIGLYYDQLRDHVRFLPRPPIFLLMISMDPKDEKDDDEKIAGVLETCFSRPGKKRDGDDTLVYVIFNKFDVYLKSLEDEGADYESLRELARKMDDRTFRLSPYLEPSKAETWDSVRKLAQDSMRYHDRLGDHYKYRDPATAAERIVVEGAFDKWPAVFERLWKNGVKDIRLCFVSSSCTVSKDFSPGVGAFWGDLCSSVGIFEQALANLARRVFVDNLGKYAEEIWNLEENLEKDNKDNNGLSLADPFGLENRFPGGEDEKGNWKREGKRLADRVLQGGGNSAEYGHSIRELLLRLCESAGCPGLHGVLVWGDELKCKVDAFDSEWKEALRRTIGELNVSDVSCEKIRPDNIPMEDDIPKDGDPSRDAERTKNGEALDSKEDDIPKDGDPSRDAERTKNGEALDSKEKESREARRTRWRERKRLSRDNFDGYKGFERGPSLASDRRQWSEGKLSERACDWLNKTSSAKPLWEAVEADIDRVMRKGKVHSEPLSEEAEEALWHVADHIHEDDSASRLPRYSCLAPRRGWGSDRLLVLSLLEGHVHPEARIQEVVEMVRSLAGIRRSVDGLGDRIRDLTTEFVASRMLEGMGFKITPIDDVRKAVEKAAAKMEEIAAVAKLGVRYFKQRRDGLMDCANILNEQALPGEGLALPRDWASNFNDARGKLKFLKLAVEAAGKPDSLDKQETEIRQLCAGVNQRCREHRRKVSTYARNTGHLLLELHRHWLKRAADLNDPEIMRLDVKCRMIVSRTEADIENLRDTLKKALESFREIVEERIPKLSASGKGDG